MISREFNETHWLLQLSLYIITTHTMYICIRICVLEQTLNNAQPAIDGLAKTAAGAGQTVLNHFTGSKN